MVAVVTANNRHKFSLLIDSMHADRKRIFVDALKWDIPVREGKYEIDQFDNDDAVYLLALDDKKETHLGSVRLLPSSKPHLLGDVFPSLCDNGVPRGDDIWEITRLCTAPQLRGREAWLARSYLAVGMVEFALLYGINKYTCVAETSWLSSIMAVGWECEPLGLPKEINGETVGALIINITPATLQLFRMKMGWRHPVLELDAIAKAA
ncbi:MAG TPA: acyl-homoserine-lactone synthase [Rhizomicrobium sp.]